MPGPALSERDLAVLRSFARRIDPSDAGAHNNLGVLYYQKGLIEEAIAEFVRALELDPRMQVAQTNLEIAYRESGHYDRRDRRAAGAASAAQPEDRDARWELGRAYAALGRHDDAIAEFQALLAWQPDDVPAMLQLGLAEKARGSLDAASDWLARACAQDPASAVARFHLRRGALQPRPQRAGADALKEAIARNPDYAEAHYLLAFVYGDLGQHEAAREATKRAIALNPDARAGAGEPRARRATAAERQPRPRVHACRAARRSSRAARSPTTTSASPSGRRATTTRRCASTAWRSTPARTAGSSSRRWPKFTCCAAISPAALELYDALVQRIRRLAQALERARRLPAPGRAPGRGDRLLRARRRRWTRRISSPGTTSASSGPARPGDGGDRGLPPGARRRPAALHGAAQPGTAVPPAAAAQGGARGVPAAPWPSRAASAVAWNGVGLVLMELRRFEDARNAFGRAVDADPGIAGAHYNLSFVLSQLGDFDGALRETRRALELEPLYVPQKFSLTIDLQYEDPTIAIAPELTAEVGGDELAGEFTFDPPALDQLFAELAPTRRRRRPRAAARRRARPRPRLHREGTARPGLGRAEPGRRAGRARAAPPRCSWATSSPSAASMARRSSATARRAPPRPTIPTPRWARSARCSSLGWAGDAAPLADELARRVRGDVEVLVARARVRLAVGDALGALDCIREAQALAPGRPDLFHLQAQVSARLGDRTAALAAFNAALQLDPSLVRVWFELGGHRGGARQLGGGARGLRAGARPPADLRRRGARAGRSAPPHRDAARRDPRARPAARGRSLRARGAHRAGPGAARGRPHRPGARGVRAGAAVRSRACRRRSTTRARPSPGSASSTRRCRRGSGSCSSTRPAPSPPQARSRARSARDLQHIFAASAG